MKVLQEAREMLYGKNSGELVDPKVRRHEIKLIREKLDEYNQFKGQQVMLGHRDRQIRGGWRHGITGIDNADSEYTSVFYRDNKARNDFVQSERAKINSKRLDTLRLGFGTSSQMPVGSESIKRTRSLLRSEPDKIVDISDNWKRIGMVKGSSADLNTHERINVPASNVDRNPDEGCMKKIKVERSLKLRKEDLRDRDYNILSNMKDREADWLDSFGG